MKDDCLKKEKEEVKEEVVEETYDVIYKSKLLNKEFTSLDELKKAEKEFNDAKALELEKASAKKERAKEVEEAYKNYVKVVEDANKYIADAQNKYLELKDAFINDYGYFHMTYSNKEQDGNKVSEVKVSDVIDNFFDLFRTFPF